MRWDYRRRRAPAAAITHLMALLAPTLAVIVSHLLTRRKLRVIHDQTNSRLTETLQQLDEARAQIRCSRCPHLPEVPRRSRRRTDPPNRQPD